MHRVWWPAASCLATDPVCSSSWLPQEELGYLKSLWDMVAAVMFTFTDWYATLWDKIDVDFLVEETKKLTKDIKQLNKAVRNYEVYRYVLQQLKQLPAITCCS